MATSRPLAPIGAVYLDPRGGERSLRVSWHHEAETVVLSLWRDNLCTGTFRLAAEEVPDLIAVLRAGLQESYAAARARLERAEPAPADPTQPIGVSPAV